MTAAKPALDLTQYSETIRNTDTISVNGRVAQVVGILVESNGPACGIGEICEIHCRRSEQPVIAEVVGFRESRTLLMPFGSVSEIRPGSEVISTSAPLKVPVGKDLLGRVVDGLGQPLDGKGPIQPEFYAPTSGEAPHPLTRRRITEPVAMGVRALDGMMTVGKGQRLGIFAGSGVGKSTLMGMIARNTSADVNVIALIGERGREVRDFIEKDLGEEGLARSVVVVATSDKSPVVRLRGSQVGTAIAEYFRSCGLDVLLMMDSVTRVAWAQREIGLASGEPPTTRGYTPSVFAMMPQLLERSGTAAKGSITGLYTVLVEGDDMNEPVADTARGILDGHIVLRRELAARNHYPAVDVLSSVSRLMPDVTTSEHRAHAGRLRDVLATYQSSEDLINIGAYAHGSNAKIDFAISKIDQVNGFLKQAVDEKTSLDDTQAALVGLFGAHEEVPVQATSGARAA